MAKRKNDKEVFKLLVKFSIVGYILVIFITCHFAYVDLSDPSTLIDNLFQHIFQHPFEIFPINWEAVGIVSFIYFLVVAYAEVCYEREKSTRPGEENGSARWEDDYGKFSSKYAEPLGKKEIIQRTGWLVKETGLPWNGPKRKMDAGNPDRTKSFVVAIKKLIQRKVKQFQNSLKDKWLDFKSKFRKDTVVDGEDEFKVPSEFQRKIYAKICVWEEKLDMDLERYKPKACVAEAKRLAEEEERERKRREMDGAAAHLRRRKYNRRGGEQEKLTATLVPVNRNMILSQNVALSMDGRATRKNCNTLILGGSGAGKTRFYLKPNLMQLNCSYVITDPSGEILQTMGKFLENAGYEIKVINLTNMDQSHCYNPFNYVREDADILVMIDVLTKNLTPPDSHSSDPFWPKAQAALLQAIAFYLYKECRPSERNFTNVMKLLRAAVVSEEGSDRKSPLDIIFEDLEKKDPNHIAVMQYSIFKQAPGKTASTILTCAEVDLAPFNLDTIANLTGVDTIDMGTIGLRPTALFCITPTAKTTYNWIISLAYTQLFETLYYTAETKCKGLRLPVHVRFLLDEFANIGQIPDFEQKLSTMRKYEISCAIIIQNMAQLETMYKESWKTIVGNCDEFIYLGGHESSSTEYVSKMLGKQTIKSKNSSRTFGRQGSANISLNATGRELMTPDEIAHMSDQDCLVMVKGVMPFFDKKYDLLKHPNYKYTGDADDDLIFNIADEIQTPQNNVFGKKNANANKRRELERQAREGSRVHDRRTPISRAAVETLEINQKNLEADGIPGNVFNQDDSMYEHLEVTAAHAPNDGYEIPADVQEASSEALDSFLDGDGDAGYVVGMKVGKDGERRETGLKDNTGTVANTEQAGRKSSEESTDGPVLPGGEIGETSNGMDEDVYEPDDITEETEVDDALTAGMDDGWWDETEGMSGEAGDCPTESGMGSGVGSSEDGSVAGAFRMDFSEKVVFTGHLKELNDLDFVILDTETTGVENDDEIVELGIIGKNGEMLYSSLFCNEKPMHPMALAKNHLNEFALMDSPRFADEWQKIKNVLQGKKIIAFNTPYDWRLFQQTLARYGLETMEANVLFDGYQDAMKIFLDVIPSSRKSISLQECCDVLRMNVTEAHRAVEDCWVTLAMLRKVDQYNVGEI